MEQPHHTTVLIGIKDINIKNIFVLKHQPHLEIQEKLDNDSPHCQGKCIKYDFQKSSKIPILDYQGFPTFLLLKKRRFQCKSCKKVTVAETALVKKNSYPTHGFRNFENFKKRILIALNSKKAL